jgi:hypothetical protein
MDMKPDEKSDRRPAAVGRGERRLMDLMEHTR